ncbi:dienelactone hydrolase family protein-like protein [Microthyrium microscopicum]|uniref:Dienelactone hydrolase family protein-like protein n=1 Tax=Microthyrium microscopicum TaxID=703497 RepID=A0A6A6UGY8_9PEZI|nr:dienelactone hydrolase family protein-like protein [Microthyrium microscopicum]
MGEHCTTDRPSPAGEVPTGELTKLGDVDVYIAKPADYPHSPSKLLLLLTGGTGLKSANNQLQADKFASEGFLVIMPDQFGGDTATGNSVTDAGAELSLLERIKMGVADTAKAFMIDMWLARHTPEKVLPILHKVIEGAKEEFADAVANGGGIYAVGYCFGARYVLLLGGEGGNATPQSAAPKDDEESQAAATSGPVIKVGAIAHGTQIAPEDISKLKVPTILVCVENDPLFPDEVRIAGVEALEKAEIEHEVKVYPEVPHGFAVLGDYEDSKIKEAQQLAFGQMLGWLQAH